MCFWTRIAQIWRIFIRVIRVIRVRITIREFGIKYEIYSSNTEKKLFKFIFMPSSSVRKTLFCCPPLHSFSDWREPLLPPKRASFFQKKEKWHFLLEKVCHVVNPRYLCIWKRTRGEATILWIVAIAKRRTRLVPVFPECLIFRWHECPQDILNLGSFALASLPEAKKKHKAMRQQRQGTNKRSLTYLLIGIP